jgi:hypothetical protein
MRNPLLVPIDSDSSAPNAKDGKRSHIVKYFAACVVMFVWTAIASAQNEQPLDRAAGVANPYPLQNSDASGQREGMLRFNVRVDVAARARHSERASRAFQARQLQTNLRSRQAERNRVGTVRMPVNGELRLQPSEIPLRERLAHIDRIRDFAIRNGNPQMLDTADRLEQEIRRQFSHRHPRLAGMRRAVDDVTFSRPITEPENRSAVMTRPLNPSSKIGVNQANSVPAPVSNRSVAEPFPTGVDIMKWLQPENYWELGMQAGQLQRSVGMPVAR